MKLLLTSAGVTNPSIQDALTALLGKPISESAALCIPTPMYAIPGGSEHAWRFISGQQPENPMVGLGWKSVGMLEVSALPSVDKELWVPLVEQADVFLVAGGNAVYLYDRIRESGLVDLLGALPDTVWVGMSAGSMVMAPRIGEDFVWKATDDDETLGLVDFGIFPHLDNPDLPSNTLAAAEKWATNLSMPGYAIDDQTAIKVSGGTVEVVSEGHWKLFTP